jgi:hypothetical protein
MTQDNPHNEMPKTQPELQWKRMEEKRMMNKMPKDTVEEENIKHLEEQSWYQEADDITKIAIQVFIRTTYTTAYKAGQASRDEEVEDLVLEIKEMGEYDT